MTPDLEMAVPEPVPTPDDPFALGWRHTPDGSADWRVPLTEDDLLYPQEGDFVVNNAAHDDDRRYLVTVFRERVAGREGLRVFGDHLIDFGVPGLPNLGPDVILLNSEPREWDRHRAVFPVTDMAARPLVVVELTSPTTRKKDLTEKPGLFYRAGVPLLVLIDLRYGGGKRPGGIAAFQAGPSGYEVLPTEPDGRVWVEVVDVFLAAENDQVVCYDPDGNRIENYHGLRAQRDEERRRAEAEKARADAEKQRADETARKIADLEAELKRLRGDAN
ncbi:MAG: hypothetical protein C0501_12805 [Isosphaera sp.]|nr:hypothetical protein [Isosphaera sp.]